MTRPAAVPDLPEPALVEALVRYGTALLPAGSAPPPAENLSAGTDALVVRVGAVVVKAHPPGTDPNALAGRLAVAADPRVRRVLARPLPGPDGPVTRIRGRLVTAWPAGRPLGREDLDDVPWEQAAGHLAALHRLTPAAPLPPAGGPARVGRALARLDAAPAGPQTTPGDPAAGASAPTTPDRPAAPGDPATPDGPAAAEAVRRAAATLPDWALGRAPQPPTRPATCHGDWHLGQLVHFGTPGWRLVDVDDLGTGDPAWDLARPAAWYAAGLLSLAEWGRFLGGYLAAGGPAITPDADPWPILEVPARAVTVQTAALAVARAATTGVPVDEVGSILVDCCRRMAGRGPGSAP